MTELFVINADLFKNSNLFDLVYKWMPETRKAQINRAAKEASKRQLLGAGFLLDFCFRRRGFAYRDATIAKDIHGKPFVENMDLFHFNVSHSGRMVACAVSEAPVGIDVEQIRRKNLSKQFVQKVCTDAELEYLYGLGTTVPTSGFAEDEQKAIFFQWWTVKESVMKRDGRGLSMGPRNIDALNLLKTDSDSTQEKRVRSFQIEDYFLSICFVGVEPEQPIYLDEALVWSTYRDL